MTKITRRSFAKSALLAGAAAGMPRWSYSQIEGANSDIRIAVVGFRGRGKGHISAFDGAKGARVVALCDVDADVLAAESAKLAEKGRKTRGYRDVRKLLEDAEVDAIVVATPNHWHALMGIWACQAGKDAYLEKPVSHNVWEGRQVVEAAKKYGRVVAAGTQCRSNPGMREAIDYVRSGQLGKIKLVRGLCYKQRGSIGKVLGPQDIPPSIDYDLWTGPAPLKPLMRQRLHYDWHWIWDTGNGDLGNQGIHQMDLCRWVLGDAALSPRVMSVGGRFGYEDDGETPNTQFIFHDYEAAPLIFEVRGLPSGLSPADGGDGAKPEMDRYKGVRIGMVVHCENGYLAMGSYSAGEAYDNDGKMIKEFKGGGSHAENFLEAVRDRKPEALAAPILEGHLSSALCHTGNISYRLGAGKSPEEIAEAIQDEPEARETFDRFLAHLDANGVDLKATPATLGPWLKMDPATERFTGGPEQANALLRREYRPPFVAPEQV